MGTLDRRQRELGERKKLILKKSKELFFRKGFNDVTIQDICEAVEYGRSAIYSMFESKEEIYSYIYLDAMKIIIDLNKSINPDSDNFDQEFMKAAENLYTFYSDNTDYYKALNYFNNMMAHSKIPEHIMVVKDKMIEDAGVNAALLMHNYIQKKYIRKVDIPAFIQIFFSSITGIINFFIYKEEEDKNRIHAFVLDHARLYLAGIKK